MLDKIAKFLGLKRSSNRIPAWLRAVAEEESNIFNIDSVGEQLDLYRKLTWLQIAISSTAKLAASTPIEVVRIVDEEEISVRNHPLEILLQKPNPLNSRFELLQYTISFLCLTGNAYWWLNRTSEKTFPEEIWLLPGDKISPVPDGNMFLRGYSYTSNNQTFLLEPWEVCHFRLFNPESFFTGLSPVQSLRHVAAADLAMARYNANYFDKNNAKIPGALAFSDPIDDETWEQLKREISEEYGGVRRKLMLLRNVGSSGVSWIPMALSQAEMQFLESRKFNKEEIFALFSPGLASILDVNATEANAQAGRATFIELAVWPLLNLISERMTSSILASVDPAAVVKFEDIRVVNRSVELEEIKTFSRFHTVNEVRAYWFQAPPLEDERGNLLVDEISPMTSERILRVQQKEAELVEEQIPVNPSYISEENLVKSSFLSSEQTKLKQQEMKAFKRWLRNHPGKPYHQFKARYLTSEEIQSVVEGELDRLPGSAPSEVIVPSEQMFESSLSKVDKLEAKFVELLEKELLELGAKVLPDDVSAEMWSVEDMLREAIDGRAALNKVLEDLVVEAAVLGALEGDRVLTQLLSNSTKSIVYLQSAWDRVNMTVIEWIRTRHWFSPLSLVQTLTVTEQNRIRALISRQIMEQRDQAWLRDQIRGVNGLYSRHRAEVIARTEVTHAFARGNRGAWEERGVQQVSWRTRVDELVCPICGPLNLQEFQITSEVIPPAHPNCRCWIVPVVDRSAYIVPNKKDNS
jgi:HK97 family phage portal protein